MGGFFGAVCKSDAIADVFFGTDYHSHLGTRRAGMAAYDKELGLQREIHNIQNSPFRTKFEDVFDEMSGFAAIGCISDSDPQPLLIRSKLGTYAICTVGIINNKEQLIENYFNDGGSCKLCNEENKKGCITCSQTNSSCLECQSNYYLFEGDCYDCKGLDF